MDRIHKLLYESEEKDKDNNLVPKFTTVILRGLGGLGVQKVCDLALQAEETYGKNQVIIEKIEPYSVPLVD